MHLVLASASPRRAELLAAAGFSFEVLAVDVDERGQANEVAVNYVRRLASEKSARAIERLKDPARAGAPPDTIILSADTAVVVDGAIVGKPLDDQDARQMLRRLSGRSHEVTTGVSLRTAAEELTGVETSIVWFGSLAPGDLEWYVSTGEGRDKAGAYAIQGLASRFIPRIEGSYSNVVGLPISLVHTLLQRLNRVIG